MGQQKKNADPGQEVEATIEETSEETSEGDSLESASETGAKEEGEDASTASEDSTSDDVESSAEEEVVEEAEEEELSTEEQLELALIEETSEETSEGDSLESASETGAKEEGEDASTASEDSTSDDVESSAEEEVVEEAEEEELSIEEQLELALEQTEAFKDQALRAQAEMENVRRRSARDIENAHKFGQERIARNLLPVIDSLEKAVESLASSKKVKETAAEGVELCLKMFMDVLAKENIEQIDPQGEPFDPEFHQAVSMLENPDMEPNSVMTVIQKGYTLNGRLMRPAMVLVSKTPEEG